MGVYIYIYIFTGIESFWDLFVGYVCIRTYVQGDEGHAKFIVVEAQLSVLVTFFHPRKQHDEGHAMFIVSSRYDS